MSTHIVAHSNQDCLQQLSLHGLTKEGLPACFGGSFSSSAWEPWRRRRCRRHSRRPQEEGDQEGVVVIHEQEEEETLQVEANLPCLVRNVLWVYTATHHPIASTDSRTDAASTPTKNKKRVVTKPNVQGPSNSNKKRKANASNHPSTSSRSTQVAAEVDEEDGEEDPKVKKRRMDAVYAQRKREKLRIETEVLEGQCQEASVINTSLRAENQRLETLVHAAKQLAELCEKSNNNNMSNASSSASSSFGGAAAGAAAGLNGGVGAYPQYLALQQQQHPDFRMHASLLASHPTPQQQQLLLAQQQQQNAYHLRGFAAGGMLD
jgi:hypothetical protein